MFELVVSPSNSKHKRYKAVFTYEDGKVVTTHFGLKNAKKGTYIDHQDKNLRRNYRARHKNDLATNDYTRAGYLSYYILWGRQPNLRDAVASYKKRFNLD